MELEKELHYTQIIAEKLMQWQPIDGKHLIWRDADGKDYYTGAPQIHPRTPCTFFHPFRDAVVARLVEDEIERRGLKDVYVEKLLLNTLGLIVNQQWSEWHIWEAMRATPEQRCRAALAALGIAID